MRDFTVDDFMVPFFVEAEVVLRSGSLLNHGIDLRWRPQILLDNTASTQRLVKVERMVEISDILHLLSMNLNHWSRTGDWWADEGIRQRRSWHIAYSAW